MVDAERCVGTGADGNLVLAVLVDHDQRHSRRFTGEHSDIADVDTLLAEFGQRCCTGVVGTNRADQADGCAGTCCRHGSVGTFAAPEGLQSPTHHRLARTWQPLRGDDEIDVDRTHHDDCRRHARHDRLDTSTRASLKAAPPARSAR